MWLAVACSIVADHNYPVDVASTVVPCLQLL